jgi:hypothetical protein
LVALAASIRKPIDFARCLLVIIKHEVATAWSAFGKFGAESHAATSTCA